LEQQTIGFRNRAEGLAKLATLRERGVALRNKAVNTQPEMEQWLKANAQWLNELYGVVGEVSVSLAARIRTLGTVGPNLTEVSQPPSATIRTLDTVDPTLTEVSQPRSATIEHSMVQARN
jgi:hypothetical protein